MNILLADDDNDILIYLTELLKKRGFNVIAVKNGVEALDAYIDKHIDMLICDEMMPEISGNMVLKEIRRQDPVLPVIMVTAKGTTADKKLSFGLGADDYIVKPVDGEELIMRIEAVCRRARINTERKITVGDIVFDCETNSVINLKNGEKVIPTKTEFAILYKLFSYPEKVFTKWEIFHEFWGVDSDVDDNIVKVYISKIRRQIERFPQISIKTVMRIGYQGVENEKDT